MKRLLYLSASLLLMGTAKVSAQGSPLCDSSSTMRGTVHVYADPRLNEAIAPDPTLEEDDKKPEIQGYRVQVYSGSDRNEANRLKNQLLAQYPDVPVYVDYQAPNFRVRIGDYRDKLEAQKMFHDMKESIGGGVLIVPDKINFPVLNGQ